jgi:acetyl-CoA synthetase
VALKANVDEALQEPGHSIEFTLVFRHTGSKVDMTIGRDDWWHDVIPAQSAVAEPEAMDSEDPLFILYTSGSTGKPKGVLHTQAGYLLHTMVSHKYVFDLREDRRLLLRG